MAASRGPTPSGSVQDSITVWPSRVKVAPEAPLTSAGNRSASGTMGRAPAAAAAAPRDGADDGAGEVALAGADEAGAGAAVLSPGDAPVYFSTTKAAPAA